MKKLSILKNSPLFLGALYLLAIFIRAPELFSAPRFWAEAGVIYFLQARDLPFLNAFLAMPLGYLSLPANLAGIVSAALPLTYAPYGDLAISLLTQLSLFWVVVANGYFDGDRLKQGLILLIPILVIQSAETWLNSINGQFWLALVAAFVLAAPNKPVNAYQHIINAVTLVLAGLSGAVAMFLTPLFLLRALIERQTVWLAYALPLAAGALIMLANPPGRPLSFPLDLFAILGFFHLLLDNLCIYCAIRLFPQGAIVESAAFVAASLLMLSLAYGFIFALASKTGRWLAIASAWLAVASFLGMLGKEHILSWPPFFNLRYFFAPAALLFCALLFVPPARARSIRLARILLFAAFTLNGILFGIHHPVVGQWDGEKWRESAQAYTRGQNGIVYFAYPLCGFAPQAKVHPPSTIEIQTVTGREIVFKAPKLAMVENPKLFLYRARKTEQGLGQWERYENGWRETLLFLVGAPHLGLCYGGDEPKSSALVKSDTHSLIIDQELLGKTDGYEFLVGYGENFASMLANGAFIRIDIAEATREFGEGR